MRRLGGLALGLVLAVAAPALGDPGAAPPRADVVEARESAAGAPDAPAALPFDVSRPETPVRLAESASPPSVGIAVWRFVGATAVVGVLLTLTLLVLRALFPRPGAAAAPASIAARLASQLGWRSPWGRAPADIEGLEIVERGYVGCKESVCVVRVGAERFLIGVTPTRISLLGRLGGPADGDPGAPVAADFARAATGVAAPRPEAPDAAFRALLERSRERLSRLESDAVPAAGRHA